jgi:hypothetical protein
MTRESILLHPGAEHTVSPQEANCAVTLSLSEQSTTILTAEERDIPSKKETHKQHTLAALHSPIGSQAQGRWQGWEWKNLI